MGERERWYCGSCHSLNGPLREDCWSCGTLTKHGIPESQYREQYTENINKIVYSDCGKELDPHSARLFRTELFLNGYYSAGKEWIEVRKKIVDEWRFGKSHALGVICGLLAFIMFLFVMLLH